MLLHAMKNKKRAFSATAFALFCVSIFVFGNRDDGAPKIDLDFSLTNIANKKTGLVFTHFARPTSGVWTVTADTPWYLLSGAPATVADFNNDGWQDIFFTNGKTGAENALFKNNKDGTFTDVIDRVGLQNLNEKSTTLRGVFFDCDNDGVKEFLALRTGCHVLFRYNPALDRYKDVSKNSGITDCTPAQAINVFDYNNDGFLDLIYAGRRGYDHNGVLSAPDNTSSAGNGGPTVFYENQGGCRFLQKDILGKRPWLFNIAIGVGDLRNIGANDIWFATDYHDDKIYLQEKDGYRLENDRDRFVNSKSGMSADFGYLEEDGIPSVYVTQVHKSFYMTGGNALWKYTNGKFVNRAFELKAARCGWGWGAKFVDFNNDGNLDIYVSNGGLSNNPNKEYWFNFSVLASTLSMITKKRELWPNFGDSSWSGYERDCLFYWRNGRYYNVADAFPELDPRKSDGRGVASADLFNTGSVGIVLGNLFLPYEVYKIEQKNDNHWIGFSLEGTKSNRDAIGAKIKLVNGGRVHHRMVQPFNGYAAQSDPRVHFGLGKEVDVREIEILWPSGIRQKVAFTGADRYYKIREQGEKITKN